MIYLDHAAATPVLKPALEAMRPYFTEQFFNPSAPYLPAKHVREAYQDAKDRLAHTIGAKGVDLVITAGATESINLAFTACRHRSLVLATEHSAVLKTAEQGETQLIPVDHHGLIDLAALRHHLTDVVDFVSVSLVNNELGTIQPLAEIAALIRGVRRDRLARGVTTPLILHSDASQALTLMDVNVARLGVDLLTINAAKCGGPKGIGALYQSHGVELRPVAFGGGQERGLRSGTENVSGAIGFAVAAEYAKQHLNHHRKVYQKLNQTFRTTLTQLLTAQKLPEPIFLGTPKHQLANFCPVCFTGIDAERLIYRLEAAEVYVATGAACAANKGTKSHVLAAIGLSDSEIAGSLRITFGGTNLPEDATPAEIVSFATTAAQSIAAAVIAEYARSSRSKEAQSSSRSQEAQNV